MCCHCCSHYLYWLFMFPMIAYSHNKTVIYLTDCNTYLVEISYKPQITTNEPYLNPLSSAPHVSYSTIYSNLWSGGEGPFCDDVMRELSVHSQIGISCEAQSQLQVPRSE